MSNREVVICAPVRTPIGAFGGSYKPVPATELGAIAIRETIRRSGLPQDAVETVVMGQVVQAGSKMNPARQAMLGAGLPVSVPAMTVNRVCGSGAQAMVSAAQEIWLGNIHCAVAGGMENMDLSPYLLLNARWGYRMGPGKMEDSMLYDGLHDAFSSEHSGWITEDLVKKFGISREAQDRFALRSQQLFAQAQQAGRFADEIVPVEIKDRKEVRTVDRDESNRPDTTMEKLAKLKPAFRPDGTITAGNAPGLNSAASAMVLADAEWAQQHRLQPLARIASYGIAAIEPGMFGMAPVDAVKQAVSRAQWRIDDVERFEINEAFAAIVLAVQQELGIAPDRVNVEGGAIAHGHPIGATGAILSTRLMHSMKQDGKKRGIVTMCIGGGQGIAVALEIL
jgi:acetyl-CoA C-acetyltransferase